jgi:putative ABC transport system permease protein
MTSDFSMLGAGAFQVQKWPHMSFGPRDWRKYERRPDLTREQGEALRALPHVAFVSIEEYKRGAAVATISAGERATRNDIGFGGVLPDYEPANGVTVARGRFISPTDVMLGRRVVFVGSDVADILFPRMDPLGQEVRIGGASWEIIGVAQRSGSILGQSKDGWAVVPWTAYEVVFGRTRNNNIAIQATSPEESAKALEEVIATLRRLRGLRPQDENDFEIFSNETSAELFGSLARMVGAATFGVCALALLVGGIGVMNIMLVTVTERTREIGIRKAIGAGRADIIGQFLAEAILLSLFGGVVGVAVGLIGSQFTIVGVEPVVAPYSVFLAFGVAILIGLFFGLYPANRAATLRPIDALRYE